MVEVQQDPVTARIGNFGKWQAKRVLVVSSVGFLTAWQMLVVSFLVPEVDYWCSPLELSLEAGQRPPTAPGVVNTTNAPDQCMLEEGLGCSRWDFDRSVSPQSVVSQFSLVCGRNYWRSLAQLLYMFGIMVGAVGSGLLSDRFGRKRVAVAACLGITLFGSFTSLSSSMPVFAFLRWCVAVSSISLYTSGYVYCMEMVGGVWCTLVGVGLQLPWALGYMALPLVAWLVPTWTYLQLAISLPCLVLLVLLLVPGLVPESPRWLLVSGHQEQASHILALARRENGLPHLDTKAGFGLPPLDIKGVKEVTGGKEATVEKEATGEKESTGEKASTVLDLFRTPGLRRSTLIMYYLWFTNSFVYYGLTLNSGSLLPGNLHVNFVIGGALEIVAYILTALALIYSGRRASMAATMGFGGLCLLVTPAVPAAGKVVLGQLGKFAITGSFAMVYVYAAEIFPTVVRNVGLGSASMFARVGSMLAPYIGRELAAEVPQLPLIIFGGTSLLAALLVLLLPETVNTPLPDSIEQGERFSQEKGGINFYRKVRAEPKAQDNVVMLET